jgi:16S rRNA (uracil1498-N3)-methyltransferase
MRISRIYIDRTLADALELTNRETLNYIKMVLRLKKKDRLILFNGMGSEALYQILEVNHKHINLEKINDVPIQNISKKIIHLYPCLVKTKAMDYIIQKCTEIGVTSFNLLASDFSQSSPNLKNTDAKIARWEKIIINACEQSGRHHLPKIEKPIKIKDLGPTKNSLFIFFDANAQHQIKELVDLNFNEAHLLIGPEGGLSHEELFFLNEAGWKGYALSMPTLRAETAAVVASTLAII